MRAISALVLIVSVGILMWRLMAARLKVIDLRRKLQVLMKPFGNQDDWVYVESGGNNQGGNIGGIGLCPCQKEYTVTTRQTFHPQKPNLQQLQGCLNNPPPETPPTWRCPDDCVQVMTHRWRGYDLFRNVKTGQYLLNCHRFAQYHCKKPDDPARDTPPLEEPPAPEIEA